MYALGLCGLFWWIIFKLPALQEDHTWPMGEDDTVSASFMVVSYSIPVLG